MRTGVYATNDVHNVTPLLRCDDDTRCLECLSSCHRCRPRISGNHQSYMDGVLPLLDLSYPPESVFSERFASAFSIGYTRLLGGYFIHHHTKERNMDLAVFSLNTGGSMRARGTLFLLPLVSLSGTRMDWNCTVASAFSQSLLRRWTVVFTSQPLRHAPGNLPSTSSFPSARC